MNFNLSHSLYVNLYLARLTGTGMLEFDDVRDLQSVNHSKVRISFGVDLACNSDHSKSKF